MNIYQAKPGSRILYKAHRSSPGGPIEVTVVEWSPSKRLVKLRYTSGAEQWLDEYDTANAEVIESLPKPKVKKATP
jgi:hypothetical protein